MSQAQPSFAQRFYQNLKREWLLYHLAIPHYRFLFDKPPADEWVSLDCETTGLSIQNDEVISIGAVKIVGNKIMASDRLELIIKPSGLVSEQSIKIHHLRERDVAHGLDPDDAMKQLLEFIGSRPLVGYYLEFDAAMLNKTIWRMLGFGLPHPRFEVSSMYYEYKNRQLPTALRGGNIDLRFTTIMDDLGLPMRTAHDAVNDSIMAAMAFIKLRNLLQ
jgi:DNA polymerase-3 subunit epsilon